MKRIFIGVISLVFATQSIVYAEEIPLTAKTAVVMEANTGTVLYEKDKDQSLPPASVTKVMSLLLVFEALDQKEFKKSDMVTISDHAASMGGSQVFLEVGEQQSVETLLKCMIISSANDATVAMAEKVAGSETAFVKKMNQRAKQLGMKHTRFQNACGLDQKGHETSAYDIALMSRELMLNHPDVFSYTKIWMDSFIHKTKKGEKEFGLSNTNKLIRQYDGCTGLKTGSTSVAKFCLSATAKRNGIHMIAVVMASNDSKDRVKDASKLLDYGFSCCKKIKRITKKEEIGPLLVEKGTKNQVDYGSDVISEFVLVRDNGSSMKKKIQKKVLQAPIKKGQVIGRIQFIQKDQVVFEQKIRAKEDIEKATYLDFLEEIAGKYF